MPCYMIWFLNSTQSSWNDKWLGFFHSYRGSHRYRKDELTVNPICFILSVLYRTRGSVQKDDQKQIKFFYVEKNLQSQFAGHCLKQQGTEWRMNICYRHRHLSILCVPIFWYISIKLCSHRSGYYAKIDSEARSILSYLNFTRTFQESFPAIGGSVIRDHNQAEEQVLSCEYSHSHNYTFTHYNLTSCCLIMSPLGVSNS